MIQAVNFWVIIPAYNEASNLSNVIDRVKKYTHNIIVVDDGSRDLTNKIAEEAGVIILTHLVNLGKGTALKTGCDYALKKGADFMIVLDADAQHNPDDIPRFLECLKQTDIVFGYRLLDKKMPFILRFGNFVINNVAKFLFAIELKDTQCGYRAFTTEAYRKIRWRASDYSMESEMIANVGKTRLRYKEVPIETIYLDRYKGTTIIDGIKIVLNMISWRVR